MWQLFKESHEIKRLQLTFLSICLNSILRLNKGIFSQHHAVAFSQGFNQGHWWTNTSASLNQALLMWLREVQRSTCCFAKCLLEPTTDSFRKLFGTWSPKFPESQPKTLQIRGGGLVSIFLLSRPCCFFLDKELELKRRKDRQIYILDQSDKHKHSLIWSSQQSDEVGIIIPA